LIVRQRRNYEALYQALLRHQEDTGARIHKGMPLVWMRDSHVNLGHPVLAKHFLMLTLVEDAIRERGVLDPNNSGLYFRAVWHHGMSDREVRRYAREVEEFRRDNPEDVRFPERVPQDLDKLWMTDFPSAEESLLYPVNLRYMKHLWAGVGEETGKALELLADYLLSAMPGCRTYRRRRSHSTDCDIVCSLDGVEFDFRAELGRYFVCECKDWGSAADVTAFAKFARVLDSTKSRFGILFSRKGITGADETRYAAREQLKLFQDPGVVVVVVDEQDIKAVNDGYNFIALLREKYEAVRLDLVPDADRPEVTPKGDRLAKGRAGSRQGRRAAG
jgi:hypothetical protein